MVKEATALARRGHKVDVVCTRTLAAVDPRDEDILATASWRVHRIDLSSRWRWRMRRAGQMAAAKAFALGVRGLADLGFSAFTPALTRKSRTLPADLYIAHYPAALPAAAAAAAAHGGAYAFDAEDFHPGDAPEDARFDRERALLDALERRHLPGCAYVTAASPGIAQAYAERYAIALPTVVLNAFPRASAPAAPTAGGAATPRPTIYWYSQTLGPERGLECAVDAIALARTRPHLHLRGLDIDGYTEALRQRARRAGVAERLHVLEPAAPSQMERLAAAYDAGLVGETGWTANRRIALTNKQFTYLLAGLPVLMSDTPGHAAFAAMAQGAVMLFKTDDAPDLARAMDEILGDPARLAASRAQAWRLGQERFNWEAEEAKLVDLVETRIES